MHERSKRVYNLLIDVGEHISKEMPNDKVQIEVDSKLVFSIIFSTNKLGGHFYFKCQEWMGESKFVSEVLKLSASSSVE